MAEEVGMTVDAEAFEREMENVEREVVQVMGKMKWNLFWRARKQTT